MAKVINLEQGSSEWKAWRGQGIGGSDAPVIMGVSPWMTPLQLWRIKTGIAQEDPPNDAMRRGTAMEAEARQAYEAQTGHVLQPVCLEHADDPWRRFSVDGATFDLSHGCEIKCPGRSSHMEALEGRIPDVYWPQVVRAFDFGFESFDYFSYDGSEGVVIQVVRDDEYLAELRSLEAKFWWCVVNNTPPETPAYVGRVEITAGEWVERAAHYIELLDNSHKLGKELDRAKAELLKICTGAVNEVGRLTIKRCPGKLTLDQKAITATLQAAGSQLSDYQKRGEPWWKIEVK